MAVKLILEAAGSLLPTNHHFQNAEHPNYISSGWGVLHHVLFSPQLSGDLSGGFQGHIGKWFWFKCGWRFDVRIGGWFVKLEIQPQAGKI
jgi:hypothetical protein